MSNSTLIGTNRVSEAEVIQVPAVPFTRTFHPIHHKDVIQAVRAGITGVGMEVVRTEYVLANNGMRMFGVWDLSGGTDELCWSVGIVNGLDRSLPFSLISGNRVFVCQNLSFSGDYIQVRRHTKGFDIDELEYLGYRAMKKMVAQLTKFQAWHEGLKQFPLGERDAKLLLVEIMTNLVIPPSKFQRFHDLYFGGVYAPTIFGFHETITDVLRDSNLLSMPKKNKMLNVILNQYMEERYADLPSLLGDFYQHRALTYRR